MDWPHQVSAKLYYTEKGIFKSGFDKDYLHISEAVKMNIEPLVWKSKYSSVATLVGCDSRGFATADGLNSKGLTVNVLYDKQISFDFSKLDQGQKFKGLSASRWGQYILDTFSTVAEFVDSVNETVIYTLLPDIIPDNTITSVKEQAKATFHLALSDKMGDSAIVEYRNSKFEIYHDKRYCVVTNEPSYDKQLVLNQYWKYLWGMDLEIQPQNRSLTAPAGHTSTQKFERASFNLSFSHSPSSEEEALVQTKSLASSCAVPLLFNPNELDESGNRAGFSTTIWINFSVPSSLKYYFLSNASLNLVWVDLSSITGSGYIDLINTFPNKQQVNHINNQNLAGCVNLILQRDENVPFKIKSESK